LNDFARVTVLGGVLCLRGCGGGVNLNNVAGVPVVEYEPEAAAIRREYSVPVAVPVIA
jgi:hypothetical protein